MQIATTMEFVIYKKNANAYMVKEPTIKEIFAKLSILEEFIYMENMSS